MMMSATLKRKDDLPAECFTIEEFCKAHRISVSTYYDQLRPNGRAPDEIHIGNRRLISKEAAARWRELRTAETKAKHDE